MTDDHGIAGSSPTGGLPVAPSLAPMLESIRAPRRRALVTPRVLRITAVAGAVGFAAGFVAQGLTRLIGLITNLAFYGRWSFAFVSPADHHLGLAVVLVPVVGGVIVGLMARFGSQAIRGHGIPEAMEQVLLNKSRIAPRLTFLKPLSAAVAIGTGGPFGAEGPIIATGGALGSLAGQVLRITADERKTLLAAGAAAGMAATFGSPVAAVLLAIELLLFEYRPRSLVPVAMASVTATGVRTLFAGAGPMFPIPVLPPPSGLALAAYMVLGCVIGVAAVLATRAVYWFEGAFERLPVHWMWWPAIGGVAVGVIGVAAPHTLGVGYDNIEQVLDGHIAGTALLMLCTFKGLSWAIALSSGTSGGTLAPLFTIGGGLGASLAAAALWCVPALGIDVRIAGLVGMAAMFAGASRALLTSVVFAFELTQQPMGLLPLLCGCSAAFLVSCLLMRHTIMTEKIARRGTRVGSEYSVDFLDQILVRDCALRPVVTLRSDDTLEQVRAWIARDGADASHQGFPVLDAAGTLVGVVTRRDLFDPHRPDDLRVHDLLQRPPVVAYDSNSLREAADHMVHEGVGRLPVVTRAAPRCVIGILTRSDLLIAHRRRLDEALHVEQVIRRRRRAAA